MFNPYRQYFYQTIFYRALNSDQKEVVPELDDVTRKYITPQAEIYEKTSLDLSKIKKQFKLKLVELNRDKLKQKKVIIWKDILAGESSAIEETGYSVPQEVGKKFTCFT